MSAQLQEQPGFHPLETMRLERMYAEEILAWTYERFERVAIVSSFQAESSVLIDIAARIVDRPEVITLDTGRLPQETLDVMDRMQRRYRLRLHVETPDPAAVREMVGADGPNLFRQSVDLRLRCCEVRKTLPLQRALAGFDAWITGLRRDQSAQRGGTPILQSDRLHGGIGKVAPLARWSEAEVWERIRDRNLEYNPLYDRGYTSIGCAPCSRPVRPGEDGRAGRWWWEKDGVKECGLHFAPHAPVRVVPA